jgi:hypothetical protein
VVLTAAGDRLYFVLDDGVTGHEPWALTPAVERPLLRNASVYSIDPVSPPLASIFPLDATRDALGPLAPGGLDPDEGIFDRSRPAARVLRLHRSGHYPADRL